jgi:arylsulfatase A
MVYGTSRSLFGIRFLRFFLVCIAPASLGTTFLASSIAQAGSEDCLVATAKHNDPPESSQSAKELITSDNAHVQQAAPGDKRSPYNFIIIMADDLSAGELACYGHSTHQTPRLDRLSAEGMRFRTAYATPLCRPTRVLLLTGQYPQRTGFYGQDFYRPTKNSRFDDMGTKHTLGDLFRSSGYATAWVGKWQLSGAVPSLITECGFDEYLIHAYRRNLPPGVKHAGAWETPGTPERYWHPGLLRNGEYVPTDADDYGPDLLSEFVVDFVQRHKDRPFAVVYSMVLTHNPYYSTPITSTSPADRFQHASSNFRSNVEYMDHIVGRIVDAVDDLGLTENTVILFTADNATYGDGKGQVTERGVRVPFIVRCPGFVRPEQTSDALVSIADVLPTCAELIGVSIPRELAIDGISFSGVLRGALSSHRDWLYSYLNDQTILRDSRWLLEGDGRLYDCGDLRDGTGYRDVSNSREPAALAARGRFEHILRGLSGPETFGDELIQPPYANRMSWAPVQLCVGAAAGILLISLALRTFGFIRRGSRTMP